MLRKGLFITAFAGALLALPAGAQASCPHERAASAQLSPAEASDAVFCLVNERRRAAGVRTLRADVRLQRAARRHSKAMESVNFFAHESSHDGSPLNRIRATGYFAGASSWGFAENIHWGESHLGSPQHAVASWMKSPPHRASMLSPRYRQLGVGAAVGAPIAGLADAITYTTNFGYRN